MKVFFYVKDDASGNCELRGGIDISLPTPTADEMAQLVAERDLCTSAGLVPCEAAEYEAQLINGAVQGTENVEDAGKADPKEGDACKMADGTDGVLAMVEGALVCSAKTVEPAAAT